MSQPFAGRRDGLIQQLTDAGVHAFLITQPINVSYLTGFTGDSSHLILSEETILVSDGRFAAQLAEECPGLSARIRPPSQSLTNATVEVLNRLGVRDVEFESDHVTVADAGSPTRRTVAWKAGQGRVESLRKIKDAGEIEQIRDAIRIAEKSVPGFSHTASAGGHGERSRRPEHHNIRRAGATWRCWYSRRPSARAAPLARRPESGCTRQPGSAGGLGRGGPFFYKAT